MRGMDAFVSGLATESLSPVPEMFKHRTGEVQILGKIGCDVASFAS